MGITEKKESSSSTLLNFVSTVLPCTVSALLILLFLEDCV